MVKAFKNLEPKVGERVFIAENATVIGDVEIGDDSSIWFGAILRGDVNYIKVGKCTSIQDGSVVHVTRNTHPTVIGSYVTVGHSVKLHGCTVKDNCLIGIGAIILDGAVINENSIVAAGTLVPPGKEFPPGSLIMGFPAVVKRELTPEEIEGLKEHALRYVKYKDEYLSLGF
ncbi:carbonic anhydrase/acetyltransferase-like protein (isoleucine patch superfamily) [Thermovibrio guaymasensis]|uniref:Carbonic anhydrase/acetyltransferase-like protein (Isoleucine patch superfamily) n=1 Tax=Thermovibrio guaymasensis TaxID=240167 RepID=A0A420W7N2_9BACT|nr:gamma carbonic anhydrase family protein [Thermovibrio guaymasensis]RKQ63313.1 carbonic anhydrase/acetyltransferase-like protein (isoleucine patch superfamily) [Thermovibrio guaymasensis]